jgi:hypothetical protein
MTVTKTYGGHNTKKVFPQILVRPIIIMVTLKKHTYNNLILCRSVKYLDGLRLSLGMTSDLLKPVPTKVSLDQVCIFAIRKT